MRISDWSSDVCSSDLHVVEGVGVLRLPLPVVPTEERMREVVQRLLPATELSNARVGFQPHHLPARIVVLAHLVAAVRLGLAPGDRSEEHTSELQSLMRISHAVFCLKKKKTTMQHKRSHPTHQT